MYVCKKCSKLLETFEEYTEHLNTAHEKQKVTIQCKDCGKEFTETKYLNRHIKKNQCLKCKNCDKKFKNKTELAQHLSTHYDNIHKPLYPSSDLGESESEHEISDKNSESGVSEQIDGFDNTMSDYVIKVQGNTDPHKAFKKYRLRLKSLILQQLQKSSVKFFVTLKVRMFKSGMDGERNYTSVGFWGGTYHCLTQSDVDEKLDYTSDTLNANFESFSTRGSGWILETVEQITLKIGQNIRIKGGSFIPTPNFIKDKKAIINVQNRDMRCFEYSMLAALHHKDVKFPNLTSSYAEWIGREFDMSEFPMPLHPSNIPKFERKYSLSINLYHIESNGSPITPLLISKIRGKQPINLLVIEDPQRQIYHYCYIKQFSRLFFRGKSDYGCKVCPYCLTKFGKHKKHFDTHLENCGDYEPAKITMPNETEKFISFKNYKSMDRHPVIIYFLLLSSFIFGIALEMIIFYFLKN